MKSNSNLFRKWFGYLITHSPELCPEKQGYAGSKVLRIKKPFYRAVSKEVQRLLYCFETEK